MKAWLVAMAELIGFTLLMLLNAGMWWYWLPFIQRCPTLAAC
ncbi:MAG TPA: hypothetical protein VGQ64_07930 [Candidatus Limnocylindrales bacterium]|nr:hypothetical protein [Candidatus Limnocylindrales bacterium]